MNKKHSKRDKQQQSIKMKVANVLLGCFQAVLLLTKTKTFSSI